MILRLLTRWNYVLQKQLVVKLLIIVVSNIHFILSTSCLEEQRDSANEGNAFLFQIWIHSLLLIWGVKNMLTTSNICIRIIFKNYFAMLVILREAKHLTKNLLLLWIRRVPFLVKLVIFYHYTDCSFIDGFLIILVK